MRHLPMIGRLLLLATLGTGCASVPEVESRLRTLRFHPNMYVVQAGDTLETIAFRYRLSPAELATLNPGIDRGALLAPGLRINVRPGTELAEEVRTRSVRDASRTDIPTAWSATEPEVAAVVTRPAPRQAVAAPVPIERSGAERDEFGRHDERGNLRDEYLLGEERTDALPSARASRADPPAAVSTLAWTRSEPVRSPGPTLRESALARENGYPREEIVPDDLDLDADLSRGALDGELQRYVGRWSWPTDGAVARGFAPERAGGQGVDIAGVPGQDVRAALDGTVVYSGRDLSGDGNLVIVRHDDGLTTTYSHTDRLFVAEDDRVLAGDPIASLGWNDRRESVLRFEVRRDGSPLDPMTFLPAR